MPINSKSLSSALIPTGKRKEDLVEEKINEIILSLLGLTDVFDFTYEEYLSLLKEKMAAQRMQGGGSSEEAELITNEYKRVKGKTGKFKVKAKKVNVNRVVGKAKTQKKSNVRLNSSKLLAGAKDTSSAPASSGGENLQDNSGILNFLKNDLMSALQSINALVSDILDNLKEQRAIDNKKAEQDRKAAEDAEKKEREKNLEGKDSAKKLGGIVDKVKKPFTSFFDQIIKFFTMVLLGSAINFLLKVIKDPTVILKPLVDFINSIVDFLNGIIAWIYNLVITPINGAIGLINTGIQGFITEVNKALSIIPGTNPITPPDPIPTIDPMDPTKGLIPQVPQNFGLNIGPQGAQQLAEGGTVYGPGGTDNVNAKLTAGESVLQVGARERQIQATGIDPLAFNVGPNANKPTFKGGLPGFVNGGGPGVNVNSSGSGNGIVDPDRFASIQTAMTPGNHNLDISKAAQELSEKRKGQGISSNIKETDYGRNGCVWVVNQIYKKAGLTPPWGDALFVQDAEDAMIAAGYQQIQQKNRRPGDIMINYDAGGYVAGRGKVFQTHIGVVLDDEGHNVISNSSTDKALSWVASPKEYNDYYKRKTGDGYSKFWRRPNPQQVRGNKKKLGALQGKDQKNSSFGSFAEVAIKQTGTSLSRDISLLPRDGEVALLPLSLNQEAQVPTSFSDTGSQPEVVFPAHDSMRVPTTITYGTFG